LAVSAGSNEEDRFVKAMTAALKSQDHDAFYNLVCFDSLDEDWVANNKMVFGCYFNQAKDTPNFTGSIEHTAPTSSSSLPTQEYNMSVVARYLIHIAPGTTMNIPLGVKNGEFRVACIRLKEK